MLKTFKQLMLEVRVGYDLNIPKFHSKSNEDLHKNYTPIHSSKLESGHHVTVAKHKETGQKFVFVHDPKGKHVGTIEAHHSKENAFSGAAPDSDKNHVIHVSKTAVHKSEQGKGLMTNVYKHLIHHGHTIRSDGHLTHTAHKMWQKISSDKNIKVGQKHRTQDSTVTKKHDPSKDSSSSNAGEWHHYVATKK